MGFAQSVMGGYSRASEYDAKKRQALIEGEAKKNASYAKATASEQADKKNLHQVGENMARVAANRRRDMGAARAAAATTGFAQEGSNTKREELVQEAYSQQMADMAKSGATASANALNEQIALRRGGDEAMRAAQTQAEMYRSMAKATRTGAFMSAVGGVIGAAGGAYSGLSSQAPKTPDGGIDWGNIKWGELDWGNIGGHAVQGANAGSGVVSAFNPFTADLAGKDWDKHYLSMLGIGKTNTKS